jgi:4-diphosphocytidyl-2-C-methyl-D-erythritol kinase
VPIVSLKAPAKINLCLEVLGRRSDGYHEVHTVLQAVDLADRLTLEPSEGLSLEIDPASPIPLAEVPVEDNLVLRTARLLHQETGVTAGARIRLYKEVPAATGLGGGSSDAAATLLGLRILWGLDLSQDRLVGLAARLGADVPFFIRGGTALGTGHGDELEPLPTLDIQWAVIFAPLDAPEDGKTARIYGLLTPAHYSSGDRTQEVARRLRFGEPLHGALHNAFEAVAADAHPAYANRLASLESAGASDTLLAGSGPSLFTLAQNEAAAIGMRDRMASQGLRAYAARFLPSWDLEGLSA